jgi:16S rRNA (guanine527-N7)-methyltransferase
LAAFGVGAAASTEEESAAARQVQPAACLDLVESDGRKAAFLREANRVMGTHARVLNKRIEVVGAELEDGPGRGYDLITARALAPLPKLLAMSENLLKTSGQLLFLKGRGADAELTESEKTWRMTATKTPSVSDPEGVLLLLTDIERRHG